MYRKSWDKMIFILYYISLGLIEWIPILFYPLGSETKSCKTLPGGQLDPCERWGVALVKEFILPIKQALDILFHWKSHKNIKSWVQLKTVETERCFAFWLWHQFGWAWARSNQCCCLKCVGQQKTLKKSNNN